MASRDTPFSLIFAEVAREHFPALAGTDAGDADRFILLEPAGRALKQLLPDGVPPDALEAQVQLLHHVYRHWAAGGWVYQIAPAVLKRATSGGPVSSRPPRAALYLQLPEQRVWAELSPGSPPEPLDGVYVATGSALGEIWVLGVFGMRRGRPGVSVARVEGRADAADPAEGELEVLAEREDGSPPFTPTLSGADRAGLYSIATPAELLLLAARLLALLPRETGNEKPEPSGERFVAVSVPFDYVPGSDG